MEWVNEWEGWCVQGGLVLGKGLDPEGEGVFGQGEVPRTLPAMMFEVLTSVSFDRSWKRPSPNALLLGGSAGGADMGVKGEGRCGA